MPTPAFEKYVYEEPVAELGWEIGDSTDYH